MIWVAIILLFLAIAVSPFMLIGLVVMVIWVCAKSWIYPSDEKKSDSNTPKPLKRYSVSNDDKKPWDNEKSQQEEGNTVLYLEERPWNCDIEEFYKTKESDDPWQQYDIDVQNAKDLVLKLKGKVSVEPDFWEQWGLDFRCNLIPYGTDLRLNYELFEREKKIPWDEEPGFWIQTNFYDAENNLIFGSEYDIDMDALQHHRVTDYCLFDASYVLEADHILVYGYRGY